MTGFAGGMRVAGAALLVSALALGGGEGRLAAQERQECRCVGADGREIENCVCFRTPRLDRGVFWTAAPRARIGVSLAEHVDGARVEQVREGSPADEAGIRVGDVISRVDGRSLREPLPDREAELRIDEDEDVAVQRLMALARSWEPGESVELELLRGSERVTVSVEPEEAEDDFTSYFRGPRGITLYRRGDAPRAWSFSGPEGRAEFFFDSVRGLGMSPDSLRFRVDSLARGFRFHADSLRGGVYVFPTDSLMRSLTRPRVDPCFGDGGVWAAFGRDCVDGARFVDLNPELGEYFGARSGVLVTDVAEGTTLGLRAGDVIVAIGGREVEDADHARRILSSYRTDEEITFRVLRRQEEIEVTGTRR